MTSTTKSARVRADLPHPIIDGDGHFVEIGPLLDDEVTSYLEEIGGATLRERFLASRTAALDTTSALASRSAEAVRENWQAMPSWWGWQTRNVLDRATAHLPKLLYDRLDEFGLDFAILYPSMSLGFFDAHDEELAAGLCRAVNRWFARLFAPYADRITVGALIPMNTPGGAVAELDYAVTELGSKSALIAGHAKRRIGPPRDDGTQRPYHLDTFGLDSDYDYDEFWHRCEQLKISPVVHSSLQAHRVTRSISNYTFNHVGGLAASHESLCKSLLLGGVTRRFPGLRVGFLEGGVAWACSVFADLVGHWQKRNEGALVDLDPGRLNVEELAGYFGKYGDESLTANLERIKDYFARTGARPDQLDDFAACGIEREEDLKDLFESRFYFGCEADDPLVSWAFRSDVNPLGARLRPLIGSDISHWDVQDMTEPVAEAYELVERKLLGEEEFYEFTFLNAVRLHAGANPQFFSGTVCEKAVAAAAAKGLD